MTALRSPKHRETSPQVKPENRHRLALGGVLQGTLAGLPRGDAGVRKTLVLMRQLVRQHKKNLPLRQLALSIVGNLPGKAWAREAAALQKWVQQNIRYVKDIRGVETVHSPDKLLAIRQGDCDDQAVLLAAMLESLGHPTRFVAVGFSPFAYSHVYAETKIGHQWVPLETINPWPMGKRPPGIIKQMIVHN